MRFLCLYKPSKPEGTPPTQKEMEEMGKLVEEGMKAGTLLATKVAPSGESTESFISRDL